MSTLQVPSELLQQVLSKMSEIESAYSSFVVTELPAGYAGEISEVYNALILANIETTVDNILLCLRAKGSLMTYFRTKGADLVDIYRRKIEKPSVAGVALPEWILSVQFILGMVLQGLTIAYLLKKIFGSRIPPKRIAQHAETILNIREVKQLGIITSGAGRTKRIRRKI